MKIPWVGLVFHLIMLLWLREEGLPSFNRSKKCNHQTAFGSRLLFVIVPGHLMGLEHEIFFKGKSGSLVYGHVTAHDCPSVFSYFSGVKVTPCLPESLDSIFDQVDRTVYSGRKDFAIEKRIFKLPLPAYFWRRRQSPSVRAELDALEGFIVAQNLKNSEDNFRGSFDMKSANSTLFLLHLGGLNDSDASADLLFKLFFDIRMLVDSIDLAYGNVGTNALLIGEESGPFALWGPDVGRSPGKGRIRIDASDVAPLVSGLLRIAVPHDSVGRLKICLIGGRKYLSAHYCNAVQLNSLVEEAVTGPLMEDLYVNTTMVLHWAKAIARYESMHTPTNTIAQLNRELSCTLAEAKSRRHLFRIGLGISCCIGWTILLIVELKSAREKSDSCPTLLRGMVHVMFALLAAAAMAGPQLLLMPIWWSFYSTFSVLSLWAAFAASNALNAFFTAQWWKKIPSLAYFSTGCVIFAEYWWRSSQTELYSLIIGVCIFSQFPVLPRFSRSPRLAKCVWWFLCISLIGCLFLPELNLDKMETQIGTQSKLFTFACTVWLCFAGVTAMYQSRKSDIVVGGVLTLLLAVAMLAQSAAKVPACVDSVKYLTLPMLLTPLLPLLGSRKKSSRLAHVVFSSAVVVVMTSTCYEPLTFHLAISAVALWTLMEQFYMPDEFGIDQFRRAVFLGIAVVTTIAVSQTQGDASFLFGFPKLLPFFELYRRTVIMSCIMTIYFTMMPLARPAYSSYVIVIIADALATLRSVISETSVDGTTEFHLGSIALMLSYYMGQLLAVPSRGGKPDIGPPSQPELPQVPNSI